MNGAEWHEHLNHLSWWEQIDRFFNPSKYSCSTISGGDTVWQIYLIVVVVFAVVGCLLIYFHLKKLGGLRK